LSMAAKSDTPQKGIRSCFVHDYKIPAASGTGKYRFFRSGFPAGKSTGHTTGCA